MMVEDETKIDSKLADSSELVEKVNDIPEASEKEIDDNLKEKASLDDIYVPEAAGIDNKELCDDPEATEAEVVGTVNDPTLPQFHLNASFVKEMQIEHDPDETSEDLKGNWNDLTSVV